MPKCDICRNRASSYTIMYPVLNILANNFVDIDGNYDMTVDNNNQNHIIKKINIDTNNYFLVKKKLCTYCYYKNHYYFANM